MRHAIGAGALGPVFRAHEGDTERDVAVKLFRLDLAPDRVHAFVAQLERLIAAGLSHPSLVTPVAAGIAGTQAYLVEELVEGESLDVILRDRGAAAPADALRLVGQVSAALDAAAVRGLLHGTLHPRDVLGADTDTARVTGIGVAQALELVEAAVPVRRPYAAPERVAGVRWDRRADVFSLAAITHELLWGRRVVGVGEQVAGALPDIADANAAALRRVFAQALAPSPGDRFETTGAFAATLSECFDVGHAAMRAAAPRRSARREPTPARTPVAPSPGARLPLEAADSEPADGPLRPSLEPAVEMDLPLAGSAAVPAGTPPAGPPVVVRAPRDTALDQPLAPVRIEAGGGAREERSPVGRRHRGAERAAAFLTPPELPLPLDDDPHRSAIWSLALTAVVFLSLGFAGGYWIAASRTPAAAAGPTAPTMAGAGVAAVTPPAIVDAPIAAASAQQATPLPPEVSIELPAPPPASDTVDAPVTPASVHPAPAAAARPASRAVRPAASRPVPQAPVAPRPGALQVDSRPAGANVYLNGRLRGRTPLGLDEMAVGEYGVRLQLDGYTEWLTAVRVEPGGKHRVAASLEPRP